MYTLKMGPLASIAIPLLSFPAFAQWSEAFDNHPNGTVVEGGIPDWSGWNGTNTGFSVVSDQQFSSAPHSVQVNPGADTVHELLGYSSGQWVLRVEQYVPQTFVGKTFFILLNKYNITTQSFEWALQVGFNGDSDLVECDCGSATPVTLPLVRGQWVEILAEIDLDADLVTIKYDGTTLASYPWSTGALGNSSFNANRIRAVNLYQDVTNFPHVTEVYYDNFSLQAGAGGGPGTNFCQTSLNSTGGSAAISATGSTSVVANNLQLSATPVPDTTGIFFYSASQAMLPFGSGFLCVGAPMARLDMVPITGNTLTHTLDLNSAPTQAALITAGSTWHFQGWFTDPGMPSGFGTTDGLTLTFQ